MKILSAILFLVSALSAWAVDTDSLLSSVSGPVLEADIHVRAEGHRWSLLWNMTDSANYSIATVSRLDSGIADNIFNFTDEVTVERISGGISSVSYSQTVSHLNRESSLRLKVSGNSFRIFAGDGQRVLAPSTLLAFSSDTAAIVLRSSSPIKIHRLTTEIVYRQEDKAMPFSDLSLLHEYLARSVDSVEGYWEYLDRDIDAPAVQLGGFYRMAVVRDGEVYRVLYLGGADKHSSLWKPMQTKALMRPTPFINNFDVSWIDATRSRTLSIDVSASMTDNSILTFSFPLLGSSIRFRRKAVADTP